MSTGRLPRLAALVLATVLVLAGAGCGEPQGQSYSGVGEAGAEHEPAIEGLSETLAGVDYAVFLTRQMNLADPEDRGYTDLDEPPPGSTYYVSFIQVCNRSEEAHPTATEIEVEDSQGNVFEPLDISDSVFAYEAATLEPEECIPEEGSLADTAPAGGALLIFELPIAVTENRPLEMHITSPESEPGAEPEQLTVTLDL
jgi:hypothetical protein